MPESEQQRQLIRQLCLKSFYHFCQFIIVPFRFPKAKRLDLSPAVHKPVLDFVQVDSIKRKGVLMPRYFGKSTLVTESKPIWDWIHDHEKTIMVVNEVFSRAQQFIGAIKENFERNNILHHYFPETDLGPDWRKLNKWSGEGIVLPHEGLYKHPTIFPAGIGGASQGIHADIIYLDDLIGKAAMMSEVVRLDTEEWFANVEELLVQPDPTIHNASSIVLIGTHYAPGDLYCNIQEKNSSYQWIKVTAEDDYGNPTWPQKLGREEIAKMKADPKRSIVFYTQMQNDPRSTDLTDFKDHWLKYYTKYTDDDGRECVEYNNPKGEIVNRFVSDLSIDAVIDPAVSPGGAKGTARTAIVIVGSDPDTHVRLVLEAWAKRVGDPKELYEVIEKFNLKYRPRRWGIETFGQQNFILQSIRQRFRDKGLYIGISELPKDTGKDAKKVRIKSLQDEFSTGQIYILKTMKDFIGEYLAFPMGGTLDLLDALGYHKHWWKRWDRKKAKRQARIQKSNYLRSIDPMTGC